MIVHFFSKTHTGHKLELDFVILKESLWERDFLWISFTERAAAAKQLLPFI